MRTSARAPSGAALARTAVGPGLWHMNVFRCVWCGARLCPGSLAPCLAPRGLSHWCAGPLCVLCRLLRPVARGRWAVCRRWLPCVVIRLVSVIQFARLRDDTKMCPTQLPLVLSDPNERMPQSRTLV